MDDLKRLRDEIDVIDDAIFALLNHRFELSKKIKTVKKEQGITVHDPHREKNILSRIHRFSNSADIKAVYETIFSLSKAIQEKKES